ncbi:hypothetical protein AB0D08_38170 [Kitasatospora sp. NPDC048540]|uniref:hypothetical protein n=1 Tax=Kitasatospora sp. NPDC048540 TaxID=3155634 RepID=UPI00340A45E1
MSSSNGLGTDTVARGVDMVRERAVEAARGTRTAADSGLEAVHRAFETAVSRAAGPEHRVARATDACVRRVRGTAAAVRRGTAGGGGGAGAPWTSNAVVVVTAAAAAALLGATVWLLSSRRAQRLPHSLADQADAGRSARPSPPSTADVRARGEADK